jgi:hypothetical protein
MWNQVDFFEASIIFSRHVVSQILNFLTSCSTGSHMLRILRDYFVFQKAVPEKNYNFP